MNWIHNQKKIASEIRRTANVDAIMVIAESGVAVLEKVKPTLLGVAASILASKTLSEVAGLLRLVTVTTIVRSSPQVSL